MVHGRKEKKERQKEAFNCNTYDILSTRADAAVSKMYLKSATVTSNDLPVMSRTRHRTHLLSDATTVSINWIACSAMQHRSMRPIISLRSVDVLLLA